MCAASTEGLQLVPQPKRDHDLFGPELLLSLRQSGCDSPDWRVMNFSMYACVVPMNV